VRCPKCGTEGEAGAWLCARCEAILDPSFLGDDILNEATRSGSKREDTVVSVITAPVVHVGEPSTQAVSARTGSEAAQGDSAAWDDPSAWDNPDHLDFGDSVILGRLGDKPAQAVLSDRTGAFLPVKLESRRSAGPAASVFIGDELAQLLSPERVPVRAHDADARRQALSPFEAEVLALVDGRSSLDEIRARAELSENDIRVAMAMLLDKAMIELVLPAPHAEERAPYEDDPAGSHELGDHTREIGDLEIEERIALSPPVVLDLDDHTRELPAIELEPPQEPAETTAPLPSPLAPHALPPPAPPPPAPPPPAPPPPALGLPEEDEPPPMPRPAMRVAPAAALPRKRRPSDVVERVPVSPRAAPEPPSGGAPPALAAVPVGNVPGLPSMPARPRAQGRAAEHYEQCMKDLAAGRVGRAWGYAKMALDADPEDEKLKALLADWNKVVALQSSGGPRPLSPAELLAASQKAEAEGDIDTAVLHMKKLCEIAKGSAAGWNRLGVLLATRQRQFRAGYDAVMRAVELEPGNLTFQSNMMKILAKVDDAEDNSDGPKKGGLLGRMLKR
jgi:hypothetical protein